MFDIFECQPARVSAKSALLVGKEGVCLHAHREEQWQRARNCSVPALSGSQLEAPIPSIQRAPKVLEECLCHLKETRF